MKNTRASGILAHITSLPSPYGIGDIGNAGYEFIDFLNAGEQSYWQFLPTGPTNAIFDYSPYMSTSAFAGSPLLLSPDILYKNDFIKKISLKKHPEFSPYTTDFQSVDIFKKQLLHEAFNRFNPKKTPGYDQFINDSFWLHDYAVFMAIKEIFNGSGWFSWPRELATRQEDGLNRFQKINAHIINYYKFEQFLFFNQWKQLKKYASEKNIQLFGDLPIYVAYDSVDVWSNQNIFKLNRESLRPTYVSGVPPDYFSKTGQRWGNPLYNWQENTNQIHKSLMNWWTRRFEHLFSQVDIVRIDHFRGFESYWSIPEANKTAIDGKWCKGPGLSFFTEIFEQLGPLQIVAEDLGIISSEVTRLRDDAGFPGMKVLQFAFDGEPDNAFLPYNYISPHCVVYTGTHDNDTTVGWYLSDKLSDKQRKNIKRLVNSTLHDQKDIHADLMYLARSSVSFLCIFPLQDVLGFGNDCRMNIPGTPTGNWRWRCAKQFLSENIAADLRSSTLFFGRGRKKIPVNSGLL